jgi:hypothetical protein
VTGEPLGNGREVFIGEAKAGAELFRREPLVIERRTGIVLLRDECVEILLCARAHSQDEHHFVELACVIHGADLVLDSRLGVDIAFEFDGVVVTDGSGDGTGAVILGSGRGYGSKCGEQDCEQSRER